MLLTVKTLNWCRLATSNHSWRCMRLFVFLPTFLIVHFDVYCSIAYLLSSSSSSYICLVRCAYNKDVCFVGFVWTTIRFVQMSDGINVSALSFPVSVTVSVCPSVCPWALVAVERLKHCGYWFQLWPVCCIVCTWAGLLLSVFMSKQIIEHQH